MGESFLQLVIWEGNVRWQEQWEKGQPESEGKRMWQKKLNIRVGLPRIQIIIEKMFYKCLGRGPLVRLSDSYLSNFLGQRIGIPNSRNAHMGRYMDHPWSKWWKLVLYLLNDLKNSGFLYRRPDSFVV